MARRRLLTGQPLLLASAGAAVVIGCHKQVPEQPVGNLMMSPSIELCIDTVPAGASVTVDGRPLSGRCTPVEGDYAHVEVSADGFETAERDVHIEFGSPPVLIELVPGVGGPELEPVGNLMSPPEHR